MASLFCNDNYQLVLENTALPQICLTKSFLYLSALISVKATQFGPRVCSKIRSTVK